MSWNIPKSILSAGTKAGLEPFATGGGVDYVGKRLPGNRVAVIRIWEEPETLRSPSSIFFSLNDGWDEYIEVPFSTAKAAIAALSTSHFQLPQSPSSESIGDEANSNPFDKAGRWVEPQDPDDWDEDNRYLDEHFASAGKSADWSVTAWHAGPSSIPNLTSGDIYIVEEEDAMPDSRRFKVYSRVYEPDISKITDPREREMAEDWDGIIVLSGLLTASEAKRKAIEYAHKRKQHGL